MQEEAGGRGGDKSRRGVCILNVGSFCKHKINQKAKEIKEIINTDNLARRYCGRSLRLPDNAASAGLERRCSLLLEI